MIPGTDRLLEKQCSLVPNGLFNQVEPCIGRAVLNVALVVEVTMVAASVVEAMVVAATVVGAMVVAMVVDVSVNRVVVDVFVVWVNTMIA